MTPLQKFRAQLRALNDIDRDEIECLNIPWSAFVTNRAGYLAFCSDHEAEMIWQQIENRVRE